MLIPGAKVSPIEMAPVLVIDPLVPACAWMPTAPSTLLKPMEPSTVTAAFWLSRLTAGPVTVGLTDPPEAMSRLPPAAPSVPRVSTGAVVEEVME